MSEVIESDPKEALDGPEPGLAELPAEIEPPAPSTQPSPTALALCTLAVVAAIGWSFAPEWRGLFELWGRDPNYSHGYLVPPIALVILWRRLRNAPAFVLAPWYWAWFPLALTLAARWSFHERGNQWGELATLLPSIFFLALALGGWQLIARAWPAIVFLGFMLPLPARVDAELAQPLQKLATVGSCTLLGATGLWVMAEGNVIHVDTSRLEVATACNGLSMMVTLAATVTATILLTRLRGSKQVLLLVSVVPIALASNILRIAATAWCYHKFGAQAGEEFAHDWAGWLMMPLAMALVGLEILLLNWLVQVTDETETPMILGREIKKRETSHSVRPREPGVEPFAPGA